MKLNFINSKADLPVLLFLILTILGSSNCLAQVIDPDSAHIAEINTSALDVYGNFYLSDLKGQLVKIEPDPLRILRYSGTESLPYNKIDASQFNRIAAFSKDLQLIRFFDRNLNLLSEISLNPGIGILVSCISMSSDNKIWIYDESANYVRKFDPLSGQVIVEFNCNSPVNAASSTIVDMKEYQNRLYLLDKQKNIYIFDNMGNFIRELNTGIPAFLSFYDNFLLSTGHNKIVFNNLYDASVKEKAVPGIEAGTEIFLSRKFLFIISMDITIRRLENGFFEQ